MTAAVIALSVALATALGLLGWFAHKWSSTADKKDKAVEDAHSSELDRVKLDARHEQQSLALAAKTAESARLAAALRASEDAYRDLVETQIDDLDSPSTAAALRAALERYRKLQEESLPDVPARASAEDGRGEDELHGPAPEGSDQPG